MEYAFPPLPPEYFRWMIVRWLCLGWNILGLWLLVRRVRDRKKVRKTDVFLWYAFAAAGLVALPFGESNCSWISDDWNGPNMTAMVSLAIAGTTLSLIKLYEDEGWGTILLVGLVDGMTLFWLFTPQLGHPPEARRLNQCKNQLKTIGLALHNYHDNKSTIPASASGTPPMSWRVALLPYVDQQAMFQNYDQTIRWDAKPNDAIAREKIDGYTCPSNPVPTDGMNRCYTAYSMPTGPHTVGEPPTGMGLNEITDGTSNTLLVVEACGAQIVWTEPRDIHTEAQPPGINLNGAKPHQSAGWLSSYHAHGVHVLKADGAVRTLSPKTDPALLRKLVQVDDGEEVGGF